MTKYELLKDLVKSGCDIDKLSIKTKNFLETMSGDCDYTLVQTPKIKLNNLVTKEDDSNTREYVFLEATGCNNTKEPFHNMERIHDMIYKATNIYSGASDDERYRTIDELPLAYLVANSDNAVFLGYSKDNEYQYYNIPSHGVVKFDSYSVNKYVKQMHDRYMSDNKEETVKSNIDLLISCLGSCNVFEEDIHDSTYVDESMCPFEIKEVTIDEFREYNGDYVYFIGHSADDKYFYFKSIGENWPHTVSILKIESGIIQEYAKYIHDTYMPKYKTDNKDNFDEIYAEEIKNNTWQERCEIGE